MEIYSVDDLRNNLDGIMLNAATGDEFCKVELANNMNAVIISEAEWNILCESLTMVLGGARIKTKED